jgi:hypothetical protein
MKAFAYFAAAFLFLLSLNCGKAQIDPSAEPVVVEARLTIRPDSLVKVDFTLNMKKNVHIFSSESRSFEVKIVDAFGLGAPAVRLPPAKRIKTADGTKADSYSGSAKIALTCRVTSMPWNMRGYIQYQACDESQCFFPTKKWFSFASAPPDTSVRTLRETEPDTGIAPENGGKRVQPNEPAIPSSR